MKRREFVDYQFSSEVLTKPTPMKDNNKYSRPRHEH